MRTASDPVIARTEDRPAVPLGTAIRPVVVDPREAERARLLRRLAADRLRDLRDDGVTVAYMARMYEVEKETMEEMIAAVGAGMR